MPSLDFALLENISNIIPVLSITFIFSLSSKFFCCLGVKIEFTIKRLIFFETISSNISPIIPFPISVEAFIFFILTIRLEDIIMFKLFTKFLISLISSSDLYRGSPMYDGCTMKLISFFLILIVLPPCKLF